MKLLRAKPMKESKTTFITKLSIKTLLNTTMESSINALSHGFNFIPFSIRISSGMAISEILNHEFNLSLFLIL